jgi:CelD/BcsL family acetyltransferase involved in cellulose biosynthesis
VDWLDGSEPCPEWDALAERAGNVFATSAWTAAWWRHWGAGRRSLIAACRRSDGTLAAVLPMYLASERPLRVLRFVGHGAGDLLGPLCAAPDRAETARVMLALLEERRRSWDVLLAQQLNAGDGWSSALGGRVLRRERSPVLRIRWPSWNAYLADRSANFRQQVRRRERRLARGRRMEFRRTTAPDALQRDLDVLFALHLARWGDRGSGAFAESRQRFHRELAACALDRGWLRLWFLELDGRPVAAWYGFRLGGVESYYQAGRDPAWDHVSVGFVLLAHTVRSAIEDGMHEYRFLRGGEGYKDRFTDDAGALETFVLARGLRGRAAAAAGGWAAGASWSRGPLGALRRAAGLEG